jgi:hypothetical protein
VVWESTCCDPCLAPALLGGLHCTVRADVPKPALTQSFSLCVLVWSWVCADAGRMHAPSHVWTREHMMQAHRNTRVSSSVANRLACKHCTDAKESMTCTTVPSAHHRHNHHMTSINGNIVVHVLRCPWGILGPAAPLPLPLSKALLALFVPFSACSPS